MADIYTYTSERRVQKSLCIKSRILDRHHPGWHDLTHDLFDPVEFGITTKEKRVIRRLRLGNDSSRRRSDRPRFFDDPPDTTKKEEGQSVPDKTQNTHPASHPTS
jgi:hypothetical protein